MDKQVDSGWRRRAILILDLNNSKQVQGGGERQREAFNCRLTNTSIDN